MISDPQRRSALVGGLWLIGFGVLFASRAWWPGILFLVAVTSIVEGWAYGRPWAGMQAGYWAAFIGVWALYRFNLAFLFIGLGITTIVVALVRRDALSKPKPFVDTSLE